MIKKRKFCGTIVSGGPVTTSHGIRSGVFKSSEPVKTETPEGELIIPEEELTPEKIEAFKKAWNEPGT